MSTKYDIGKSAEERIQKGWTWIQFSSEAKLAHDYLDAFGVESRSEAGLFLTLVQRIRKLQEQKHKIAGETKHVPATSVSSNRRRHPA